MIFGLLSFVGTVLLIFSIPVLAVGGLILYKIAQRRALNGRTSQGQDVIESEFVDEDNMN